MRTLATKSSVIDYSECSENNKKKTKRSIREQKQNDVVMLHLAREE